jgi:hypothetical protein
LAPIGGVGLQKEDDLVKCKNGDDLVSVLMLPLCILILSNRKGISQGGQHQKCSP